MPKHIIDSGDQSITGNLTTSSLSSNSAEIPTLNGNIVVSNNLQVVGQISATNQNADSGSKVMTRDLGDARYPKSITTGITGASRVLNVVQMTSSAYADLSAKDPDTIYIVTY